MLGFEEYFRLPEEGEPGYVGLRREHSELAVVTEQSPQQLIGVEIGSRPRFELFVYVEDVDGMVDELREDGIPVLREAEDMFWGERVAYVTDRTGIRSRSRQRPSSTEAVSSAAG